MSGTGKPRSFERLALRAIEILLRKCVPDLAHVDIAGQATQRYVVEVPFSLSRDEWQRKSPPAEAD